MDVVNYNQKAWDRQVANANRWTLPVSADEISEARTGNVKIVLTPTKNVPAAWFPQLSDARILCLAGGGGQQGPLLAAAGGNVTVFDNSEAQLAQDQQVADREQLTLRLVQGDMRDLSAFSEAEFDLIVHPCSNVFVPTIAPVWQEAARVLRVGGVMLTGFTNPLRYAVDDERTYSGKLVIRHPLPYSDLEHLTAEELKQYVTDPGHPLEFGHTLSQQIGDQLKAGFVMTDLFEDRYGEDESNPPDPLSKLMDTFIATRMERVTR